MLKAKYGLRYDEHIAHKNIISEQPICRELMHELHEINLLDGNNCKEQQQIFPWSFFTGSHNQECGAS